MFKKILPIKIPRITGYLEDAHPLSIIECYPETFEWINSNFIQLVYEEPIYSNDQPLKFFKHSSLGKSWDYKNPYLNYYDVPLDLYKEANIDIILFIKSALKRNFYIELYLDEFYLPFKRFYKKEHYSHETLIYGIDDDYIYIMAYDKKIGKYISIKTEKINIARAFYNNNEQYMFKRKITLLSYNNIYLYNFNKKNVVTTISDFLTSKNSFEDIGYIYYQKNTCVFGLEAIYKLKKYINDFTNIIPFEILVEHSVMFKHRIIFMVENKYINDDPNIYNICDELIKQTHLLKKLVIKNNFSNRSYRDIILQKIDSIILLERKLLMSTLEMAEKVNVLRDGAFYSEVGQRTNICHKAICSNGKKRKINLSLELINSQSKGFIGFSTFTQMYKYQLAVAMGFNTLEKTIGIKDENIIGLINKGSIVYISLELEIETQRYILQLEIDGNTFQFQGEMTDVINEDDDIYVLAYHENSYRFLVRLEGEHDYKYK